jgi:hypothetical protein
MIYNIILDEFQRIKREMNCICMSMHGKFMALDMHIPHIIPDVLTK